MRPASLAAIAWLVATALPAAAGDWADRAILGFSPDGATFAFEEFGVQDGSGFPYANVYVVDTATDAWVKGTPVRILIEDETADLEDARAMAIEKAEAVIAARGGLGGGYRIVASNPPTELSADPHAVRFLPDLYANQPYAAWDLALTLLPMPDGEACANLGPVFGFRLDLTDPDGSAHVLHEDGALPASRFCPTDYAITDVIVSTADGREPPALVVLLNLIRQGFEGPDRRYLAVAARLPGL
jgi:predicted secreted protein